MKGSRNPFTIRASEHIVSESDFLRLFAPGVLELLPENDAWNKVHFFVSAPGGGKTTLFRIFSPPSLTTLHSFRSIVDYKELYRRMREFGVMTSDGPDVLGIRISCARNYGAIEDLDLTQVERDKLFFSLFNSRVTLSALNGILILKGLRYPDDLNRLSFESLDYDQFLNDSLNDLNGEELRNKAKKTERNICNSIDSFTQIEIDDLIGHHDLNTLGAFQPSTIKVDGKPVAQHTVLLIDDFHRLTKRQREVLTNELISLRLPVGIWIAERLEAQEPSELLSIGTNNGREFEIINLEKYWRRPGNSKRFEKTLWEIADLRVRSVPEIQSRIGSFESSLKSNLDNLDFDETLNIILRDVSNRAKSNYENGPYAEWISEVEAMEGSLLERITNWRTLEILIQRKVMRGQSTLFDLSVPQTELENIHVSSIREAAMFFISREFSLPYYFGSDVLANLASSNIEQFLSYAGKLFDVVSTAGKMRQSTSLAPKMQESILKAHSRNAWESIQKRIPNGLEVKGLLEHIKTLTVIDTQKPNAPYAPGATGIAITMDDKAKLTQPRYEKLLQTLSTCISNNLLEPMPDVSQGGKKWYLLYLNRALCLQFGLPLQYGGWRPRKLNELEQWVNKLPKREQAGGAMFL